MFSIVQPQWPRLQVWRSDERRRHGLKTTVCGPATSRGPAAWFIPNTELQQSVVSELSNSQQLHLFAQKNCCHMCEQPASLLPEISLVHSQTPSWSCVYCLLWEKFSFGLFWEKDSAKACNQTVLSQSCLEQKQKANICKQTSLHSLRFWLHSHNNSKLQQGWRNSFYPAF